MTTITFDTLAFTEELTTAGVPETHAKAQARAMSKVLGSQELATKLDIKNLELSLELKIAETKTEILKWLIGLLVAQTGIIIAAFKLIP